MKAAEAEIGGLTGLLKIAPEVAAARNSLLALLNGIDLRSDDGEPILSQAKLVTDQPQHWLLSASGAHLHLAIVNGQAVAFHPERVEDLLHALDAVEPALNAVESRLGLAIEPEEFGAIDATSEVMQIEWHGPNGQILHSMLLGLDAEKVGHSSLAGRAAQLVPSLADIPIIVQGSATIAHLELETADALDRGDLLLLYARCPVRLAVGDRLVHGQYDCASGNVVVEQGEGRGMGEGQGQGGFTVPVSIALPQRTFSAEALAALQPGATLPLGPLTEGMPVEVSVGGRPIARGELVQVGNQFAVLIEERADLSVAGQSGPVSAEEDA